MKRAIVLLVSLAVASTALAQDGRGRSTQQAISSGFELAGEYVAGTITMTVTALPDGTVTLLFPGQPLYHLQPQTGLRYSIRELAAFAVEFQRDRAGVITQMQVFQPPPQQNFVAVRRQTSTPAAIDTQAFVGEYQAGTTRVIVAARPDGALLYIVPGQPVYDLQSLGGLRFALKGVANASIEFQRTA